MICLNRPEGASLICATDGLLTQSLDSSAIARKLDVQIAFDGTVHQNQLRVMCRMINADGFQLWSERFETEADPNGFSNSQERTLPDLLDPNWTQYAASKNGSSSR